MKTKTLSDYPGLIGQILRRRQAREQRREARELRRFLRRNGTNWPAFWLVLSAIIFGSISAGVLAALLGL